MTSQGLVLRHRRSATLDSIADVPAAPDLGLDSVFRSCSADSDWDRRDAENRYRHPVTLGSNKRGTDSERQREHSPATYYSDSASSEKQYQNRSRSTVYHSEDGDEDLEMQTLVRFIEDARAKYGDRSLTNYLVNKRGHSHKMVDRAFEIYHSRGKCNSANRSASHSRRSSSASYGSVGPTDDSRCRIDRDNGKSGKSVEFRRDSGNLLATAVGLLSSRPASRRGSVDPRGQAFDDARFDELW